MRVSTVLTAALFLTPVAIGGAQDEDAVAALIDGYIDQRFEAPDGATEALLKALAQEGTESPEDIETALRSRRAAYADLSALAGKTTAHDVDCYHVDYATKFLMYVPKDYDPSKFYSVVVVGHGGNSSMSAGRAMGTAKQYLALYAPKVCATMDAIVIAPASERGWGPIGYSLCFSAISEVKRMVPVDPDRIYITGQSMGGHLAYRAALLFPDAFGAVSPHSGGYDFAEKGSIGNLLNVPGMSVFGSSEPYGINGDNKKNEAWGKAHGLGWTFVEKDGGHTIYQDALAPMARFFEENPRDLYRDRVYLRHGGTMLFEKTWGIKGWPEHVVRSKERPLKWNRKHWVEVQPWMDGEKAAVQELYATHDGEGKITVTCQKVRRLTVYLHPEMMDLAEPVTVSVNGEQLFSGTVSVDPAIMLNDARELDDRGRIYWAKIDLDVETDKAPKIPLTD